MDLNSRSDDPPESKADELLAGALARYFATDTGREPPEGSFAVSNLNDTETLEELIRSQPPRMVRGPRDRVSGIMVAKVYGAYAVSVIFGGGLFDKKLPIEADQVYVKPEGSHGLRFWVPIAAIRRAAKLPAYAITASAPHTPDRNSSFRAHLERLFEQHIGNVFSLLEKTTGGDQRSMWSLLSTNIKTLYLRGRLEQYRQAFGIDRHRAAILERDEETIFEHGAGGPFPQRDRNPLVQPTRLFEPPEGLGEPMYLRTKCCLRYRIVVDGEAVPYCGSCPKIGDTERVRLLRELHAEDRE